jgi:hypothetical protein
MINYFQLANYHNQGKMPNICQVPHTLSHRLRLDESPVCLDLEACWEVGGRQWFLMIFYASFGPFQRAPCLFAKILSSSPGSGSSPPGRADVDLDYLVRTGAPVHALVEPGHEMNQGLAAKIGLKITPLPQGKGKKCLPCTFFLNEQTAAAAFRRSDKGPCPIFLLSKLNCIASGGQAGRGFR